MNTWRYTGPVAEVRWSYASAASLASYALESTAEGTKVRARVVSADDYRLTQSPLTFVVPGPAGQSFRWPIQSCAVTGSDFSAVLGAQE